MKKFAFWMVIGILGVFASLANAASIATGQAWLDWSYFEIRTIDVGYGTPTITWLNKGEYVEASAGEEYQSNSAEDWPTLNLNVSVSQGGASASASVNNSQVYAYADPFLSGVDAYSRAYAYRSGEFEVSGSGMVMFLVPYHLKVSLSKGSYGYSNVSAWLDLDKGYYDDEYYDEGRYSYSESKAGLYKNLEYDGDGYWFDDGILAVALYFNDGETGYFEAGVDSYTSAAVPLPSALFLLGGGLIGIASWRKIKT